MAVKPASKASPQAAKTAKPAKSAKTTKKLTKTQRATTSAHVKNEPRIKRDNGPGAPSSYTPELLERAKNYLVNYRDAGDVVPTIAGMAVEIGTTRDACYFWERQEDKPEFAYIMSQLRQIQERGLVNSGLQGEFNSTITKLMMSKHGYVDRVEQALTSPDGSMSPKEIDPQLVKALVAKLVD